MDSVAMDVPGDGTAPLAAEDRPAEPEPPRCLSVEIVRQGGDWRSFEALEAMIHQAAAALARHADCASADRKEASIVLAGDGMLRDLNRTYRGKDSPTNVLSFPFQAPRGGDSRGYLGDVVISVDTVRREADELNVVPAHHVQHLVVHGLLHLLGHDHETDAEAEQMERLEAEILAKIGLADPYAEHGLKIRVDERDERKASQ